MLSRPAAEPPAGRSRLRKGPRVPPALAAAGLLVAAAMFLPLAYLVIRAFDAGPEGAASHLLSSRTFLLTVRTVTLTAAVTAGTLIIGVPLAWLTYRSDLPGRRIWTVVTALPLVIPSYVGGYVFVAGLGPRGMLQRLLAPIGIERLPEIYGFFGAWLVLTLFTYPYVLLSVRAALKGLDPSLEEASRTLARGRRDTFLHVVLPQLRPAMAAGGLLVALYTLHDFGAVSLLRYDTFTSAIYLQYRGAFDRSAAAILSLVLILLSTMVVAGELRTRKAVHYHRVHSSGTRTARPVALGRWKWPAFAGCTVLSITALGVPLAVIGYWLARGISQGEPLRLTATAAWGSIQASALGAALVVAAAIPVAFLSVRHPSRTSRLVERSTYIGYALPGIVVALALVFFGIRVARPLYQTMAMLAFAYLVLFLPLASGNVRSSLLQMNPRLEDAARVLGSGKIRTLTRVVLPLMKPGILTAAALTFLTAMKELPATLLLAPIGYSTLATQVWNATSEAFFARAAAPALALIALASLPLALLVAREEAPI